VNLQKLTLGFLYLSFALSANAAKKSINLNFMQQNLHYLHKEIQIEPSFEYVSLKGPKFVGVNGYEEIGVDTRISTSEYFKQLSWSQSVFPALAGGGVGHGTAFYVGSNLILTNKHVAQTTYHARECGKFEIDVAFPFKEKITCKEVQYCSMEYDFCLLEMNNFKNGDSLDEHLPAFPLKDTKNINDIESVYAIGNAVNFGIQGSKASKVYREVINNNFVQELELFIHYAPTFGGSSGSPLIDQNGDVIGINFAEKIYRAGRFRAEVGDKFYNLAVPMDIILKELRENVPSAYAELGQSKKEFIEVDQLLETLKSVKSVIYSENEFKKLLSTVGKNDDIFNLKTFAENQQIEFQHLKTDQRINEAIKFLLKSRITLKDLFIDNFNLIIKATQKDIIKNKRRYQSVRNSCQNNNYIIKSIDGCVFKEMFRLVYLNFVSQFAIDKSQKEQLWSALVNTAFKSKKNKLYYPDDQINKLFINHAFKEITPLQYFVDCFVKTTEKFKEFSIKSCIQHSESILANYQFELEDRDLLEEFNFTMKYHRGLSTIVEKFKYNVTSMPFQCAFRNKKCKERNYKRLLKNWGYTREISDKKLSEMMKVLLKFHRRF